MAHQSSKLRASVTSFSTAPVDTAPAEYQPPGVDEEIKEEQEYESLEDALTS